MVTLTTTTTSESTWARLVSNLFSPPVVWGVMAFPIALRDATSTEQGLLWAVTYIVLVCLTPAAYVAWMVRRGHITDLHMRVREQRIKPFLVTIACAIVASVLLNAMGATTLLITFAWSTTLQILAIFAVTLVWQISMHTMSVTAAVVTGAGLFGLGTALLAAPLIPIVGAARYSLRRHTFAQLIAGTLLGGGLTFLLMVLTKTV